MSRPFDTVIVVDWSASAKPSPARPSADAIWMGVAQAGAVSCSYHRTRAGLADALWHHLDALAAAGRRTLLGFDFPFGYPQGFARRLTGSDGAPAVWSWMAAHLADDAANANNRFALAAGINRQFGGGPFWGRPRSQELPDLPERRTPDYGALGLAERRCVERLVPRAQPVWKLYTTGSVGGQALTGLPLIDRLSRRPGCAVWPFEGADAPLVLAEIYPALIASAVRAKRTPDTVTDEVQVRLLSQALQRLSASGALDAVLADVPDWPGRQDEGWILGAGHPALLTGAAL